MKLKYNINYILSVVFAGRSAASSKPAGKVNTQSTNSAKRLYACKECNSRFTKPALLKRHQLTHTGEQIAITCELLYFGRTGIRYLSWLDVGDAEMLRLTCCKENAAEDKLTLRRCNSQTS